MSERVAANLGIVAQAVAFLVAWSSRAIAPVSMSRLDMPSVSRMGLAAILALCAASLVFRSRQSLGPQWSIQARTIPHHRLITTGPYGVVRHPIYLAVGLFLVAVCVVAATWWAFIVALGLNVVGSMLRIRAEERLLSDRFGPEFEKYRQRVPALVPRLRSA